jgi:hypothetical protein
LAQPTHLVSLAFIQQDETIGAKIFVFRDSRSVDAEKTHDVLLLPNTVTRRCRRHPDDGPMTNRRKPASGFAATASTSCQARISLLTTAMPFSTLHPFNEHEGQFAYQRQRPAGPLRKSRSFQGRSVYGAGDVSILSAPTVDR